MHKAIGKKISIFGAGQIGGTLASYLAREGLFEEILLLDRGSGKAEGKALDISQGVTIDSSNSVVLGTDDPKKIEGSDCIVITAGKPRTPGMSRDDLLKVNISVVKQIGENITKYAKDALVIVVTNPLDGMVWSLREASGLPKERVIGMGGVLDTARFKFYIADSMYKAGHKLNISDIDCMVLGSHNDTMVPLVSEAKVKGFETKDILSSLEDAAANARKGGGTIVKLLGDGSAFFAPAISILKMVKTCMSDSNSVLPCSVHLDDFNGWKDFYAGMPCVLGKSGLQNIQDIKCSDQEMDMINKSCESAYLLARDCEKILKG